MLLIETKLDGSPIHRFGIFAITQIKEETPIWRFTPGFDLDLHPTALDMHPDHFRQVMMQYGYIDCRLHRFILCCDNYRFINHCDNPNVVSDRSGDMYGVDLAARDIWPGEELTIDYQDVEGVRPRRLD
ncbi:MAG TPA: SET domain-containing protein [Pirellulaceae bacterium]|nr:SET domain-containing protein [Pirellulaceae bacterium]HMO90691.1 SET domain-containing protein [Pirellulaceae bacterium]HMP67730.1 SET domain-containing protein [Pirellulaceae bacterium]